MHGETAKFTSGQLLFQKFTINYPSQPMLENHHVWYYTHV